MKEIFKHIKVDKIIRLGMTISGFLLIVQLAYVVFFYTSLPPLIPLFNQMPWGESRLTIKAVAFLPILITISFFFLNFFLIVKLYEKIPLLARMLSITTLLITLLAAILIFNTFQLVL
jgi:hypothetical protein